MSVNISLILGGARSGKSSFVLNKANGIDGPKAYIATAEALDNEMAERIGKHKDDRGPDWNVVEEPINITKLLNDIKDQFNVIVLDCLTLWLSNAMHQTKDTEKAISEFIDELRNLKDGRRTTGDERQLFVVSNEVGMGIVPENDLAREFRDHAGFLHQKVAEIANDVYMVAAGIPIKIK